MKALCYQNQLLDQFKFLDLDFDNAMILLFDIIKPENRF